MEDWSVIQEFPSYSICRDGYVMNNETGRILKPQMITCGYIGFNLWKENKGKIKLLHRLLALAFIPNPENKEFIDHINRNKLDNRLENLRWATRSENSYNTNVRKDNQLGEKNISFNHSRKRYEVQMIVNSIKKAQRFKTMEDAIAFRDAL